MNDVLNLANAKRILVIRFSSLGDILLTTPFLRVMQKEASSAKIDYLIKTSFADAIKLNTNISEVFSWQTPDELEGLLNKLREKNYDFIIDLQNNFRSKKVVKKIGCESFSFVKPNLKKFLLVQFKINLLKEIKTIPERYVAAVPDLELDEKGLELFLPEDSTPKLQSDKPIIGLIPGAFHFTKRWHIEYYAKLGNMFTHEGYQVVIFGGKSDREICGNLQRKIEDSVDLSNDNNLLQTATDMKGCKLIVCNDSGLMHTATTVGVPVVSIFGSTVREFGFAPFGVKSLIVENEGLSCRPCSHIGKAVCSKQHFKCMAELTPKLVYSKIKDFTREL